VQEVELAEVLDHGLLDRPTRWKVKSNSSSGLSGGEAGGLDAAFAAVAVAS